MTRKQLNDLGTQIIAAAIEVHRNLGPGLLESVYEHCLIEEFKLRNINAQSQVTLPLYYKGKRLNKYFVIDVLVENEIVIELKCVETIKLVHEVQLVTYLKLSNKRLGYLLNFNVALLSQGIKRKVNKF